MTSCPEAGRRLGCSRSVLLLHYRPRRRLRQRRARERAPPFPTYDERIASLAALLGNGCSTLALFPWTPKSPTRHCALGDKVTDGVPDDLPTIAQMAEIGIGMLGYAFMGKAHSNAFRTLEYLAWPPPLVPRLVAIAGRNGEAVAEAARRYGYERWTTDWHDIVTDERIGLFDNGGPNSLHADPTIAAAEAGKHVLCEKPLGRTADESYEVWRRVAATGIKHLCGFNYRFVPAVRLARELIDEGALGELRHFRGRYLQAWADDPTLDTWRFDPDQAGSGALGDLGTHVIDLARYLVGELSSVAGIVKTFVRDRKVDDAIEAAVEFESGAVGTIESTRLALGRRNAF